MRRCIICGLNRAMKKLTLILVATLLAGTAEAAPRLKPSPRTIEDETVAGPVTAEVLRVYDGDTLTVRARVWPKQVIETDVRIRGYDSPEIRGKCETESAKAREARDFLRNFIVEPTVQLSNIQQDKYGNRVNADVSLGGTSLAQVMLSNDHGRPYSGDTRQPWCSEEERAAQAAKRTRKRQLKREQTEVK